MGGRTDTTMLDMWWQRGASGMDVPALRPADRGRRTDADAGAASGAGRFVQLRNERTANARPEADGLLRARVTAGLAGGA
jgi:hypothetical protein